MQIIRTIISVAPFAGGPARVVENVLVDPDNMYTSLPRELLRDLAIAPVRVERFESMDGRIIEREVGFALIDASGRVGPTIVIFGDPGDIAYIGAHALSALRLRVDPVRKVLVPAGPISAAAA